MPRDAVLERVRECWASFFSPRALFYRAQKAVLADTRMAVVVQEMVQADRRRDVHGRSLRNRREYMVVEGAAGLGEAIVSGKLRPTTTSSRARTARSSVVHSRRGARARDRRPRLDGLRRLGLRLETFFGSPQDVDGAPARELLLLQSSPSPPFAHMDDRRAESPLIPSGGSG